MTPPNYINLTALGTIYGVKAQDVGRWLKGLGLRQEDGRPSQQAIRQGFVQDASWVLGDRPGSGMNPKHAKSLTACAIHGGKSVGIRRTRWVRVDSWK